MPGSTPCATTSTCRWAERTLGAISRVEGPFSVACKVLLEVGESDGLLESMTRGGSSFWQSVLLFYG